MPGAVGIALVRVRAVKLGNTSQLLMLEAAAYVLGVNSRTRPVLRSVKYADLIHSRQRAVVLVARRATTLALMGNTTLLVAAQILDPAMLARRAMHGREVAQQCNAKSVLLGSSQIRLVRSLARRAMLRLNGRT
jgi:hypothetical protein